jgi:CheY-like chemotaxis protein
VNTGPTKKKILVVDDNEIVTRTLSLKLQAAGYEVITAVDGSAAVTAVRKVVPDLVLLDLSYPPDVAGVPWDGFRIMEWLRRLDSSRKIPIIIISGSQDPADRQRGNQIGAVAYFPKPIDHEQLLKVIRATLGEASNP